MFAFAGVGSANSSHWRKHCHNTENARGDVKGSAVLLALPSSVVTVALTAEMALRNGARLLSRALNGQVPLTARFPGAQLSGAQVRWIPQSQAPNPHCLLQRQIV